MDQSSLAPVERSNALLSMLGDSFLVLYGDSCLPIDYGAVLNAFRAAKRPALMTVFGNADAWDKSNVWWEDHRIKLYSKREQLPQMRHVDYGLMVLPRRFLMLTASMRPLICPAGYKVFQRYYEIGSPAGLAELDTLLRRTS